MAYEIKDDVYQEIVNEFEQIRIARSMYISKDGNDGAMHLLKEIFNNGLDECVNPNSPANKIDLTFDEKTQTFGIVDNGRGIPFDLMINVSSKKHTSTKFVREGEKMKDQAGRNGVGMVVTVALSDYFSMISYRGNENKMIEYVIGKLDDHEVSKTKKAEYGLAVTFKPSSKYLGADINIKLDMVETYLRCMSYVLPKDITVNYIGTDLEYNPDDKKKSSPVHSIKYRRKGLVANVEYLSSTLEFPPVELLAVSENFDIELAFSYDKTLDDSLVNSYGNYIITTEGGSHEIVAQRAICDFFSREAKKLDPNNKFEVTYEDCRKGLIYVVNCRHVDPAFEGQHKSKVSNRDVLAEGKGILTRELYRYFNNNNALLRKIITYLRQISKIRLEAHKIKGIAIKKQTSFLNDAEIKGYYPISDRNYQGYTEIIISEGDSAGIAIENARNNKHQAIYAVMGVVDNVFGLTTAQMLTKSVFRNLTTILGCGVGKDFDITKLRFTKIIIETDADTDGANITSLIFVYFICFVPELIYQGKLFKALPPLLLLDVKSVKRWYSGTPWMFDKNEYYAVINSIINDNIKIALADSDTNEVVPLGKRNALKWLEMNSEYLMELNRLESRTACITLLLEYVCYYKLITINDNDESRFKELIEGSFNELTYDTYDHNLIGSINGEPIAIIVDSLFMKMAKRFIQKLSVNPTLFLYCKNKNDAGDTFDKMTIGQFLLSMAKLYNVKIVQRYKGLGEANSEILFATTLNPKLRKLRRFTVTDIEKTMEIFELLHARTDVMRQKRRDLLDNAEISYMDLDN